MLRTAKAIFSIAMISVSATADDQVRQAVAEWQPIQVTQDGGKLTVVAKENQVTKQIFLGMIEYGFCTSILLGSGILKDVDQLRIANSAGLQAWSLAPGQDINSFCMQLGDLTEENMTAAILDASKEG